jgi:Zn-finger nucleic acid-binding protein
MAEVELDGVNIDRCGTCGGVWLDDGEADELAKALDPSPADEMQRVKLKLLQEWKTGASDPKPVERSCPRCEEHMVRVNYKDIPGLQVEKCAKDCGMYLDKGELEKVRLLG